MYDTQTHYMKQAHSYLSTVVVLAILDAGTSGHQQAAAVCMIDGSLWQLQEFSF